MKPITLGICALGAGFTFGGLVMALYEKQITSIFVLWACCSAYVLWGLDALRRA
jgi:hypothetical protein